MLPVCTSSVVTKCTPLGDESKWQATVRATIVDKKEAETWLTEYERINFLDFRVQKTKKENTNRLVVKVNFLSNFEG
jgi:hypothetical protein